MALTPKEEAARRVMVFLSGGNVRRQRDVADITAGDVEAGQERNIQLIGRRGGREDAPPHLGARCFDRLRPFP